MSKQTHSRHRADLASHAAFSEHSGSDTWGVREHDRVIRPGDPGGERPVQPWPPTEDNPMTDTFDERGQYDNDHPEGPPPKYIPKERRSQPDASDPLREAARRVLREADRDTDAFIALRAALGAALKETAMTSPDAPRPLTADDEFELRERHWRLPARGGSPDIGRLLATLDAARSASPDPDRMFATDRDTLLEFIAWCVDNPIKVDDIFLDPEAAEAAVAAFLRRADGYREPKPEPKFVHPRLGVVDLHGHGSPVEWKPNTAILDTLGDKIAEAEAAIAATVDPARPDILRSGFGVLEDNIQANARRKALIEARDLIRRALRAALAQPEPLDVERLAEAMAADDLALPPGNDRERTYWRTNADQLDQARRIAAEYTRLSETPR